MEQIHGLIQHLLCPVDGHVRDHEAGGLLEAHGDVHDRVDQAACRVHDRERAILLRVHLRQTARLVARGHQEEVAAGHHLMFDGWVEAHVATSTASVGGLGPAQGVRVLLFAVAHHDELRAPGNAVAGVVHQPRNHLRDDVNALLPRQAADEADKAHVRILRQAQRLLQVRLVRALALDEVVGVEVLEDFVVRVRVPNVVDAVEDAAQAKTVRLPAHIVLQGEAALARLDLVRVVR
mmetsp:Transcript_59543/g.172453  ORF Transcript_59543/g.172453 Transcript_59543/m.172453 type:complete len:236 (+) Transcript_59543:226-933(+)